MTIKIRSTPSGVRSIRPGDEDWFIYAQNGLMMYPRAHWKISNQCPANIRSLIVEAVSHEWITIEANVYEREITWEKLNETE